MPMIPLNPKEVRLLARAHQEVAKLIEAFLASRGIEGDYKPTNDLSALVPFAPGAEQSVAPAPVGQGKPE